MDSRHVALELTHSNRSEVLARMGIGMFEPIPIPCSLIFAI